MSRDLEADARAIHRAALEAVDPGGLVRAHLRLEGDSVACAGRRFLLKPSSEIRLVGAGKAACAMAAAVEDVLGSRLTGGLVLAVEGTERPLKRLGCHPCPHPVPDARSVLGTRQLLSSLSGLSEDDLVVACWAGGGSSCLGLPIEGILPEEVVETTRLLLAQHLEIGQVNQVRRVLLAAGNGGVARASAPARILALVLCDAPLADVSSGPTMPGAYALDGAIAALKERGVWPRLPAGVRRRLAAMAGGDPRAGMDPGTSARAYHAVIGDNATAVHAAARKAAEFGYAAETLGSPLQGEARQMGERLGDRLRDLARKGPYALLAGGETTVAVKGPGRGGRCQELALGAALALRGTEGIALLSAATDGVDGSSDAAGAVVTGRTCASVSDEAAAREALEPNDSHAFFLHRQGRLVTGPTGTNVADLAVGLAV